MQRSFSVIEDEDIFTLDAEEIIKKDNEIRDVLKKENVSDLELTDSEEHSISSKRVNDTDLLDSPQIPSITEQSSRRPSHREQISKIPSAILSGRQTVLRKRSNNEKLAHVSSDSEDSEFEEKNKFVIPNGYDPKLYEHLEVDDETNDIFQYILKYTPQQLNLDFKFKPFIPEFLPAVGDIDAFLKVIPPDTTINGDKFDEKSLNLGLTVLDEPALNQSDQALLHLQLRAASVNPLSKRYGDNMVVKTVNNLEINSKVIDKWIKDISDLHKSKSSPVVRYSEPMPDLDDLMQGWPEEVEAKLKETGFPKQGDMTLSEYVDTVCNFFQIPIAKKKVQSLHLLFCLYAAIKQTQLYQTTTANNDKAVGYQSTKKEADQLVLD